MTRRAAKVLSMVFDSARPRSVQLAVIAMLAIRPSSARADHAEASDAACGELHLESQVPPEDPFKPVLDRACEVLTALKERDPRARVVLRRTEEGVHVLVTLADGRTARRVLADPYNLSATLEALLALPPPLRSAVDSSEASEGSSPSIETSPSEPPSPVRDEATPADAPKAPEAEARHQQTQASEERSGAERPVSPIQAAGDAPRFDFEGAVLATGRLVGPPFRGGLGLVAEVDLLHDSEALKDWRAGIRARVDAVMLPLSGRQVPDSLLAGGGVELGRRFRPAARLLLDVGIGVDIVAVLPLEEDPDGRTIDGANGSGNPSDGGGTTDPVTGESNVPARLGPSADVQPRAFAQVWRATDSIAYGGLVALSTSPLAWSGRRDASSPGGFGVELGVGVRWGGR